VLSANRRVNPTLHNLKQDIGRELVNIFIYHTGEMTAGKRVVRNHSGRRRALDRPNLAVR